MPAPFAAGHHVAMPPAELCFASPVYASPAPCVAKLCPRNERRCSASPPRCHARLNRTSPSPGFAVAAYRRSTLGRRPALPSDALALPYNTPHCLLPRSAQPCLRLTLPHIARLCPFRAMLPSAHAAQCHALPCPCRAAFGLALPLPRRHAGLHDPVLCPPRRHAALRPASPSPCRAQPRRASPCFAVAERCVTRQCPCHAPLRFALPSPPCCAAPSPAKPCPRYALQHIARPAQRSECHCFARASRCRSVPITAMPAPRSALRSIARAQLRPAQQCFAVTGAAPESLIQPSAVGPMGRLEIPKGFQPWRRA